MTSTRRTFILTASLVLIFLVAIAVPVYRFAGPHARFVRDLEKSPLVRLMGDGSGVWLGPEGVRQLAKELGAKGYDLLADYKRNLQNEPVRLSLAYLLLMQENDGFLSYYEASEERIQELARSKEHSIWAHVIEDDGGNVSEAFCRRMVPILRRAEHPECKYALGQFYLRVGKDSQAMETLLDLINESNNWSWEAGSFIWRLPVGRKAELLLPFLVPFQKRSCDFSLN